MNIKRQDLDCEVTANLKTQAILCIDIVTTIQNPNDDEPRFYL